MKKFSKFLSMVLVLCSIFTMLPAINIEAEAAGVDGITLAQIDSKLSQWAALFGGGKYWNGKVDHDTLKALVDNGSLDTLQVSAEQLGLTYSPCSYPNRNTLKLGSCTSNNFGGGKQCRGFSMFIEYAIFHSRTNTSDYTKINSGLTELQPGDMIVTGSHNAVVWKVEGDRFSAVQCQGGKNSGCVIYWGDRGFWGSDISTDSTAKMIDYINKKSSDDNFIVRYNNINYNPCDHSTSTLDFAKYGYCTNCGTVDSQKVAVRNNAKTYQLTLDIMSRTGPYSAAPNAEQMFTGETFVALGEYENMIYVDDANHVWLRFEKNGRTCFVNTNSVTEIKAASTLSVSDMKMPEGHFDSIRKFGLRGKFSSNYDITRILALVYDSNGTHFLNYDVNPNRKSYDIQTDGLNDAFAFGKLPDGSYTYSVTAYDASGAEKNVSSTFSIGAVVNSAPAPVVTPTPTPAPTPAPVPTYLPVYEAPVLTPVPTQAPVYEAPVITPAPTQAPVYQAPAAPAYTPPQVFVSDSNITIDLAYNNSFLVQLAITGDAPAGCYFNLSAAGPFVCEWNNNYSFTVIANAEGAANLDVLLCDAYGQTIASSTIYVNIVNSRDEFIFENPQTYSSYPETPQEPVYQAPEVSTLSITGTDQPSGYFASLSNYGLRGIISSNYDITRILAYVYDAYGNAVLCYDTAPYRKSYDIQYDGLNNAFSFGSLPSGSYTYSVTAYDAYGAEKNVTSYFEIGGGYTASASTDIPIVVFDYYMTVNVGAGSTLRFCSYVSVADQYEIASIPNGTTVYVYGTTMNQYEDRTWAKINYNGIDGWVNYKWLS